jgi:hypothetical protein
MPGIKMHSTSMGSSGTVSASKLCDRIKMVRGFIKKKIKKFHPRTGHEGPEG